MTRVPDASCPFERSFYSIKLSKIYNHSTMNNNGLSALGMLNIFLDFHPTSEDVLCRFTALGIQRLDFDI